eukprot:FR741098.1.p1 GENE.FR741098.1~~FR741098.1.p1  ORF type:complete len:286 (+),score=6.30 FR741098.1:3-860(+)
MMVMLASVVVFRGTLSFCGLVEYTHGNDSDGWHEAIQLVKLWPESLSDVLISFPVITLSYLCHFNALSMHAELTEPTRPRLKQVIFASIGISTFVYICFGITGYLWAGHAVNGDILNDFSPKDPMVSFGRVGLMIAVSCNIPLFVLPARDIIFGLLYSRRTIPPKTPSAIVTQGRSLQVLDETSSLQPSDTNGGTDSQNGTHGAAPRNLTVAMSGNFDLAIERRDSMPADPSDSAPQWLHVSMTLLIVVGSWATAVVCPGVEVIWSFCGSTVGICLAYIFPPPYT